jgi:hypothetical protein
MRSLFAVSKVASVNPPKFENCRQGVSAKFEAERRYMGRGITGDQASVSWPKVAAVSNAFRQADSRSTLI